MQAIELLARVLVGQIFLFSGIGKVAGYSGAVAYMDGVGVPGSLLPLVIALEIGGGVALIVGWRTRWMAFLLAGFSILAAAFFHFDFAHQAQLVQFQKNLTIAGGLLLWVVHGAGAWSVDQRRRPKKGMFA